MPTDLCFMLANYDFFTWELWFVWRLASLLLVMFPNISINPYSAGVLALPPLYQLPDLPLTFVVMTVFAISIEAIAQGPLSVIYYLPPHKIGCLGQWGNRCVEPCNAKIFLYKQWRLKVFFQLKSLHFCQLFSLHLNTYVMGLGS